MIDAETILAKKYARAFLNCYGEEVSFDVFKRVCMVAEFFAVHKDLLFFSPGRLLILL